MGLDLRKGSFPCSRTFWLRAEDSMWFLAGLGDLWETSREIELRVFGGPILHPITGANDSNFDLEVKAVFLLHASHFQFLELVEIDPSDPAHKRVVPLLERKLLLSDWSYGTEAFQSNGSKGKTYLRDYGLAYGRLLPWLDVCHGQMIPVILTSLVKYSRILGVNERVIPDKFYFYEVSEFDNFLSTKIKDVYWEEGVDGRLVITLERGINPPSSIANPLSDTETTVIYRLH